MDSTETEDSLAWEEEVKRVNNKFIRSSLYIVPVTFSGGISFGVLLTMPDRFWEFALIYFFPIIPIIILHYIRHKNYSNNLFIKFLPEITLFTCAASAAALADRRFLFFAGLVNLPLFIAISMGTLKKKSEALFTALYGVSANVLIFSIWHHFTNYNSIVAAWLIVLPIALISYYLTNSRYSSQRKTFFMTQALNRSNNKLALKNKEIIDSITYAKHLQEAILPPDSYWLKNLPDSFILYKPKDIVAGDFYWMEQLNDWIYFASADCTGHGVPGAIVSVVCSNAINRTLLEFKQTDPGKILDKTRELVIATFEKSDKDVKDGMDISLCCLNTKTLELHWAGANNPLWYIHENELTEIKADKQPIGKYSIPKPYTTHKLQLEKGDSLYLFTDGYADQFGGTKTGANSTLVVKGKKFKYKQLKSLLLSLSKENIDIQKQKLNTVFEEWKGNLEQVDDVCIIGIRL